MQGGLGLRLVDHVGRGVCSQGQILRAERLRMYSVQEKVQQRASL